MSKLTDFDILCKMQYQSYGRDTYRWNEETQKYDFKEFKWIWPKYKDLET